jgi:hypothetical protein
MKLYTNGLAFALAATTIQCMMSSASGIDIDDKSSSSNDRKRALRRHSNEFPSFPSPSKAKPSNPTPSLSCPSGSDIEFIYEGLAGVMCETISFFLNGASQFPDVEYSYSLAGLGNDIPGNADIGLTSYRNPVINQPNAPNYIFVAKVKVGGCPLVFNKCLLDCVPGGPSPSPNDPPFCEYI